MHHAGTYSVLTPTFTPQMGSKHFFSCLFVIFINCVTTGRWELNRISQTGLEPIIQSTKWESPRWNIVKSRENGDSYHSSSLEILQNKRSKLNGSQWGLVRHRIAIRPSKKNTCVYRVTWPYLNLLVKPKKKSGFLEKIYNFTHFERWNTFQNA